MTAPMPFSYEGRLVRTVLADSKPWFVAADVAAILGYRMASDMTRRLDDDERGYAKVRTPGGEQQVVIVTESGLYHAIFGSQLASAVAFRRWVTEEVIPAVRRDGGYISPAATAAQLAELQARVLRNLTGIVDANWLEAKARHVAARGLGEEPELDPARRPLTVGEYLVERGITGVALRTLSPKFGKWVKAEYRRGHGRAPMPVDRFVDGALRKVAGYAEADRPLFDRVWNDAMQRAA